MKLIDLTRINQLIDGLLDKINDKYATKAELNSGLKGKAEANHGMHLTLGNTQDSAYRGDYGNVAYQHSQTAHAPRNAQKNSDITKAEIEAKLTGTISSHNHSGTYAPASHTHSDSYAPASHGTHVISSAITTGYDTAFRTKTKGDANSGSYFSTVRTDTASVNYAPQYGSGIAWGQGDTHGYLNVSYSSATAYLGGGSSDKLNWVKQIAFSDHNHDSTYAPASHGTHLTIGTGANNAAAGNHTHNYAGSSSAGGAAHIANVLNQNARMEYGWSGLNYFNISGAAGNAAKVNDTPTTAWWHIIRCNHANASGYYTDIAVPFNETSMYYKRIAGGSVQNGGWVKMLDALNWSEYVTPSTIGAAPSSSIGTLSSLQTSAKGNLVAAINELFQNANNGKQLIANAIGDSGLTSNSTFSAMSDAITDTRNRLYNLMVKGGYDVNSNMNMDSLLNLLELSGISVGEIKQIACGYNHTFILKHDGSLYSCGYNISGQLGLGDNTRKTSFTKVTANINNDVKQVACGSSHTIILKKDGSIWSCGGNGNGQLGLGSKTDKNTFTKVNTNINNDVKQIACGEYHTFIFKNDGSAWCCGLNNYGQLGLNDTTNRSTFTQVNINNVKQIVCGNYHTIILKNDGSIWSCGYNGSGQLGLGNTANKSTFTKVTTNVNNDVKQIACGQNCTFILKTNGSVWACGYNSYGQLGLGTTDINYNTFTQVTTNINNDVKQIACGEYHTVILKNDGSIWSCGRNDKGQLGISGAGNKNTFTQVITNISNDVKLIACGGSHTFILKANGGVWSCGYNYHGQLGLDNNYETGGFTSYTDFTYILRGL